jgi:hypothetical protein
MMNSGMIVEVKKVSERAGHKKTDTVMGIFAHAVPANNRVSANLIGDLLRR